MGPGPRGPRALRVAARCHHKRHGPVRRPLDGGVLEDQEVLVGQIEDVGQSALSGLLERGEHIVEAPLAHFARSLGVDLCFQDFDSELAGLPEAARRRREALRVVVNRPADRVADGANL